MDALTYAHTTHTQWTSQKHTAPQVYLLGIKLLQNFTACYKSIFRILKQCKLLKISVWIWPGAILENMKKHGWSADNLAFGSGGALLQRLDRDTQKCAYKCSFTIINGKAVSFLFCFGSALTCFARQLIHEGSLCLYYYYLYVCISSWPITCSLFLLFGKLNNSTVNSPKWLSALSIVSSCSSDFPPNVGLLVEPFLANSAMTTHSSLKQ